MLFHLLLLAIFTTQPIITMASWSVASTVSAKAAINPIREATETHYPEIIELSQKDIYSLGIGHTRSITLV